MNKLTTTLLTTLILLCFFSCQKETNQIEDFNNFIGKQKSKAFNQAIESYYNFLEINFQDCVNTSDRTKAFLTRVAHFNIPDSTWTLTTDENQKIIELWDASGLRKEIWIYGYESYESRFNVFELLKPKKTKSNSQLGNMNLEEIVDDEISVSDSLELVKRIKEMKLESKLIQENSLSTNINGEFLYGLSKYASTDSVVNEYVQTKVEFIDISPSIMALAFLDQIQDYEDPFIQRMILVEMYYWTMIWDLERKK